MRILRTDKRLIDEGYRYKIEGNLSSDKHIDLTDLDKRLYVTGYIKADGYIKAGECIIEAGECIRAGGSYGITSGLYITCKDTLSFGLKVFALGKQ